MRHNAGIAVSWTSREDEFLVEGLARYSTEPSVSRYSKIAYELPDKTIRDVAMRCRWITLKENAKRRKEDDNGLGRARTDIKEHADFVLASQHGTAWELLKQNEQLFNQISAKFTSLMLIDNLDLFNKSWENIKTIISILNGIVSEPMKHMPPLPDLNEELFVAIFPPSNLPTFS